MAKLLDAGASGSFTWAQAAAGDGGAIPLSLLAHGADLYLSGIYFGSTATFGSTALVNAGTGSYRDGDAFVAKLTDGGGGFANDWALRAGGTGRDSASTLLLVGNTIYVGGKFSSYSANFGTTTLINDNQSLNYHRPNLFVAQIIETATGAAFAGALSAHGIGTAGYNAATALALAGSTIYVAGFIGTSTTFGSANLVSPSSLYTGYLASLATTALPTRSPTLQAALGLYPNPAHGAATVRVPAGTGPATLTLLDALGRVVRVTAAPAGADYLLGLTGVAPGIYTLRVQVGDALATHKLAVE
ncbi:MAG: T9SS type A sorting domain-containing protein [Janthinobacterium lividum]